jgi:HSP20 family protein
MADVNVKDQSSKQGSESSSQSLQRQGGTGISRGGPGGWDPWGFSLTPADFFSSNPFTLMRRMSEEMDRVFGHTFGHPGGSSGGWYPAVDVREQNGQLQVHAELPGLKPEDVKVEVTDDALIIRGERKYEREHQAGKAYRSERRYGEFYREIALPEGVKADQAKAQFNNGVLEVTVPIPEEVSRRREIPIQTEATSGSASAAAAGAGSQGSQSAGGSTAGSTGSSGQRR